MRKIVTALMGTLVAFGIVAMGSPAQAAMPSNAPLNYVSLWDGIGFTGAAYPISDDWTGCRAIPTYFNDLASSVANNSNSPRRNIRFFSAGGCSGSSYLFYGNTSDGQLSSGQGNNTYSSYRFE